MNYDLSDAHKGLQAEMGKFCREEIAPGAALLDEAPPDVAAARIRANLKTLAGYESAWGVSNIIGIDIFNEPWDYTWAEWSSYISQAYTAINAVNPNILIFAEGISDTAENQDGTPTTITAVPTGAAPSPNWGGNLYEAGANPPAGVPKSMLVFTPHVYGISVFVGKQFVDQSVPACVGLSGDAAGDAKCPLIMPAASLLAQGWDAQFGYLKAQGYAVVIGEFGGNMIWPGGGASLRDINRYSYVTDHTIDGKWQNAFVSYLHSKCINDSIYWSINPESGDTGGLYTTPYNAVSNTGGWGTWGGTDSTKLSMLATLWNTAPGTTCGTTVATATPGTGATATRTPTAGTVSTGTRTPTAGGPTATRSRTPTAGVAATATRTNTPVVGATNTPVPTTPSGGACSPVTSTITAPFTYDGAGTFCWQSSNLGSYINSWNLTSLSINGTNETNLYVAAGSYPAKINGYWYVSYNSTVSYGHFEAK